MPQLTGVGAPYEVPTAAEVVLDTERSPVDDSVEELLQALTARGLLPARRRARRVITLTFSSPIVEDFMSQTMTAMPALTRLAEDEVIFRDSVYEFADKEIRPLAREMDEQAKFSPELIKKLFELGVMSVEVPETLRRRGRHLLPLGARGGVAVARRSVGRRARRRAEHAGDQRRDALGHRRDQAQVPAEVRLEA